MVLWKAGHFLPWVQDRYPSAGLSSLLVFINKHYKKIKQLLQVVQSKHSKTMNKTITTAGKRQVITMLPQSTI